jgi:hypothetical protein
MRTSDVSRKSPTSNGRCIWIEMPAKRLLSASCSDKPMTAVSSADVVRMLTDRLQRAEVLADVAGSAPSPSV